MIRYQYIGKVIEIGDCGREGVPAVIVQILEQKYIWEMPQRVVKNVRLYGQCKVIIEVDGDMPPPETPVRPVE